MKINITIDYNWSCNDEIDIPEKHREALKEDAHRRIFEMMAEGYYSGELFSSVRYGKDIVPEEDEEDGLEYSGYWSIELKDEKDIKLPTDTNRLDFLQELCDTRPIHKPGLMALSITRSDGDNFGFRTPNQKPWIVSSVRIAIDNFKDNTKK